MNAASTDVPQQSAAAQSTPVPEPEVIDIAVVSENTAPSSSGPTLWTREDIDAHKAEHGTSAANEVDPAGGCGGKSCASCGECFASAVSGDDPEIAAKLAESKASLENDLMHLKVA